MWKDVEHYSKPFSCEWMDVRKNTKILKIHTCFLFTKQYCIYGPWRQVSTRHRYPVNVRSTVTAAQLDYCRLVSVTSWVLYDNWGLNWPTKTIGVKQLKFPVQFLIVKNSFDINKIVSLSTIQHRARCFLSALMVVERALCFNLKIVHILTRIYCSNVLKQLLFKFKHHCHAALI